jgi:hypothetical protein
MPQPLETKLLTLFRQLSQDGQASAFGAIMRLYEGEQQASSEAKKELARIVVLPNKNN